MNAATRVVMGKTLYGNFLCLVLGLVVETKRGSSAVDSEAGLNTTLFNAA